MSAVPPASTAPASPPGRSPLLGFKQHLRVEPVAGDATYVVAESGVTTLRGESVAALAPLLDGTRDLAQLCEALSATVSPAELGALVAGLVATGLVRPGAAAGVLGDDAERAYWDLAGIDSGAAARRLAGAVVTVVEVGDVRADATRRALQDAGLAVGASTEVQDDLTLVLTDDYLRPELAELDRRFAAEGRAWLLARPDGGSAWIGPVFRPGDGACWHCLAHRLEANRSAEAPLRRALGITGPLTVPVAYTPASRAAAAALVAAECTHWLAGVRHPGQQGVTVHSAWAGATRTHAVQRRPQCPHCGDPGLVRRRTAEPVRIAARPVRTSGTGCRAGSAQDTLETYRHLVDPVTGVVPRLQREQRLPDGMHCYVAGRNPAATAGSARQADAGLRQFSGGKGVTALDAEVGALCEALERYSGELDGDELRIRARFRDLVPGQGVHPHELLLLADDQFDSETDPSARFEQVCDRFDPDAEIDWTPVWSLTGDRHRLVPTAQLYFDTSAKAGVPDPAGARFALPDSNGNAAGSSLEDAIVQGFLELVERDAVALWWYNRTRQPAVDLDDLADPFTLEQRRLHADRGRELTALDVTSDLGIPVVVAISRRTGTPTEDICFGFGAHPDPAVALRRAVAEVAQLMPAALAADGTGRGYLTDDVRLLDWWRNATVANQPWLVADPALPATGRATHAVPDLADAGALVARFTDLAREHGLELLVLDQTRPDIGLPTVKVIVPGLRPFWARFAPGRLYDVPVALGRVPGATGRADLNPIAMFV